jgi:hypothetical protein
MMDNRLMRGGRAVVLLAVAMSRALPLFAQSEDLTSNRPGIGESEALVASRVVQVEGGFSLTRARGGTLVLSVPELMLRVGLAPRFELSASADGFLWSTETDRPNGSSRGGLSDVSLDAKLGILREASHGLTLSAAGGVSLPTGGAGFSSGSVDPSIRALWSRSLPLDLALGGNLALVLVTGDERRVWLRAVSMSVSRPLTTSSSWFVEMYGLLPERAEQAWTLDGGLAVLPDDDVQLDVSGGRRVGAVGPDWFVSAGLTMRRRPRS